MQNSSVPENKIGAANITPDIGFILSEEALNHTSELHSINCKRTSYCVEINASKHDSNTKIINGKFSTTNKMTDAKLLEHSKNSSDHNLSANVNETNKMLFMTTNGLISPSKRITANNSTGIQTQKVIKRVEKAPLNVNSLFIPGKSHASTSKEYNEIFPEVSETKDSNVLKVNFSEVDPNTKTRMDEFSNTGEMIADKHFPSSSTGIIINDNTLMQAQKVIKTISEDTSGSFMDTEDLHTTLQLKTESVIPKESTFENATVNIPVNTPELSENQTSYNKNLNTNVDKITLNNLPLVRNKRKRYFSTPARSITRHTSLRNNERQTLPQEIAINNTSFSGGFHNSDNNGQQFLQNPSENTLPLPQSETRQETIPDIICFICAEKAEDIVKRRRTVIATKCGHTFCKFCFRKWLTESPDTVGRCPICRKLTRCNDFMPLKFA